MTKQLKSPLNKNTHWERISRKILFENPRITLIEDEVELPEGDQTSYLLYGLGGESITVICVYNDKVLLQKEYSYPPDKVLYQFPGGKVNPGEPLLDAARRELIEESQLSPADMSILGWYYVNNRRSDTKMHVVTAKKFKKNRSLAADNEENITSSWIPLTKLEKMIKEGKIVNIHVLAAWALYRARKQ